jgi:hypothetical protein
MNYFEECVAQQIEAARQRALSSGWGFKERGVGSYFIGDFVGAVMAIETPENAKAFYEGLVLHVQAKIDAGVWESACNAEEAARADIGWCFGEGMSPERIAMWSAVCAATHPVFGTSLPTPAEAYAAGLVQGVAGTL